MVIIVGGSKGYQKYLIKRNIFCRGFQLFLINWSWSCNNCTNSNFWVASVLRFCERKNNKYAKLSMALTIANTWKEWSFLIEILGFRNMMKIKRIPHYPTDSSGWQFSLVLTHKIQQGSYNSTKHIKPLIFAHSIWL